MYLYYRWHNLLEGTAYLQSMLMNTIKEIFNNSPSCHCMLLYVFQWNHSCAFLRFSYFWWSIITLHSYLSHTHTKATVFLVDNEIENTLFDLPPPLPKTLKTKMPFQYAIAYEIFLSIITIIITIITRSVAGFILIYLP